MVPCSATGHATTTEPIQGFQDPRLVQIFASGVILNTTTPATTSPATTTLPPNGHSHSSLPVGAIAGGTAGGFVLVLLIAAFFILRKRRRQMAVLPQPLPIPELASAPLSPQELGAWEINELSDGIREDTELPSNPISGFPELAK